MNLFIIIIVIYLLNTKIDRKMGYYSKAKVTIDLDEYNTLLQGAGSEAPYNKLLSILATKLNMRSMYEPPLELRDLVDLCKKNDLIMDMVKNMDRLEVRSVKYQE